MPNSDSPTPKSSKSADSNDSSVLADPFIGFELEDKFLITELLGAGGFGNVYKAKHLDDGSDLAIKIIHKHHMQNAANLKRFEQEARLLSRLQSPYIVRVISHGLSPAPYIVMEYFDGMPLNNWLKINGPMSSQFAIDLFLQLCDGLTAAQSIRIVHRDLKPANILLTVSGSRVQAKILDFGLAKFADQSAGADKLTSTGDVLGSPPYMSPEQWKGQCDHRSDIYALGCIMYEVLAGRPAFSASFGMDYLHKHFNEKPERISDVNLREKFPPALEDIVSKCMQKSPVNRYQSAAACSADLKKVKIGRAPLIILAEDEKTKSNVGIFVAVVSAVTLVASMYFLREPIIHAVTTQLYSQADAKLAMGQSDDAIGQYRQILFLSQMLAPKDKQKLHALNALAALLNDRKEYTAAQLLEKQANELIGDAGTKPELLLFLHKIKTSIAESKWDEAEKLAKSALQAAESTLGKQTMASSTFLDLLGTIAFNKNAFAESVIYEKESLVIAQELLEQNDLRKGEIMEHLSAALKQSGNLQESETYSALALALKNSARKASPPPKKETPPAPPVASTAINNQGELSAGPSGVRVNSPPITQPSATGTSPRESAPQGSNLRAPAKVTEKIVTTHSAALKPKRTKQQLPAKPVTPLSSSKPVSNAGKESNNSGGWGQLEKLRSVR